MSTSPYAIGQVLNLDYVTDINTQLATTILQMSMLFCAIFNILE